MGSMEYGVNLSLNPQSLWQTHLNHFATEVAAFYAILIFEIVIL